MLSSVSAETLKDPRTRDETIANAVLTATVNIRTDGMYEYTYNIKSPDTNKGIIGSLSIDISCDINFGEIIYTDPRDPYFSASLSEDGKHVPVQSYGVYALTTYSGISVDNFISWGMNFKPGRIGKGIKLISPAPPGLRTYSLRPSMQPDGWDYDSYEEEDPTIPWIEDFRVTGQISAPACSSEMTTENNRFEGQADRESFGINKLLTYKSPSKDPVFVTTKGGKFQLNIYYGSDIDKDTFKATLNNKNITHLFKPVPSTNEIVTIMGEWSRSNRLFLSVSGINYIERDYDGFHIWFNRK